MWHGLHADRLPQHQQPRNHLACKSRAAADQISICIQAVAESLLIGISSWLLIRSMLSAMARSMLVI